MMSTYTICQQASFLTLDLCLLISTAIEDDVVVFPTPPLPPTKIHFNVFYSMMFLSVGSN